MNFEQGMNELQLIIEKLESGNVGFEDASKLFERGAEICKDLNKSMESAKGKVTIIREELGAILEQDLI